MLKRPSFILFVLITLILDSLIFVSTDKFCPDIAFNKLLLAGLAQVIIMILIANYKTIWQSFKHNMTIIKSVLMITLIVYLTSFVWVWIAKQGIQGDKFNRQCGSQSVMEF